MIPNTLPATAPRTLPSPKDIVLKSPDALVRENARGLVELSQLVRTPPEPPRPVRKMKVDVATLKSLGIDTDDIGVSELRDDDDALFYVSNARSQGGYGKFRLALSARGHFYAVKEFRTEEAGAKPKLLNKHSHAHTHLTRLADMYQEIERVNTLSSQLRVRRVINWHGKYYAIMTLMTGELADALTALPSDKRAALARAALPQITDELRIMHGKGVVHGDIKLHNALWNKDGKITLTDFGFALPLGDDGLVHHGARGTYMPPEMFKKGAWDTKADTWSLGASLTDAYVDTHNPLSFLRSKGKDGVMHFDTELTRQRTQDFARWRRQVLDAEGRVVRSAMGGDALWSDYFVNFYTADSALCAFVVERMLDPHPSTRADMDEVLAFSRARLTPECVNLAKKSLEQIARYSTQQPVLVALTRYRNLRKTTPAAAPLAEVPAPLRAMPKRRRWIWWRR